MTVSMPAGVDRHFSRRVRNESALEGRAARSAPRGRGLRLGACAGAVEDGMGSPEGRSAIGAGAVTEVSGADASAIVVVVFLCSSLLLF